MSKLSKNIIYNLAGKTILLLISLIAVKNIFSELGKDIFGIIYFSEVISAVVALVIDKSTRFTIVREISSHIGNNPKYVKELVRTYALVIWLVFLVVAFSIFVAAPFIINHWITISSLEPALAVFVFRLMGIVAISSLVSTFYRSVLDGTQRMDIANVIDVIMGIAQRFGIVIILNAGGGVYYTLSWITATTILQLLLIIIFIGRILDFGYIMPGYFKGVVNQSSKFNAEMMAAALLNMIQQNIDVLLLSKFFPVVNVGYYATIKNISSKTSLITGAIFKASYPSVCELHGHKDETGLKSMFGKLNDLVCMTSLATFVFGLFLSFPLLTYLFGNDVAGQLMIPFFLLLLGQYMNSLTTVPWMYSLVAGLPNITRKANFLSLLIFAPISYLLIKNFGIKGAGFSLLIYNIVYWIYALPVIYRDCLKTPFSQWYMHVAKISTILVLPYVLSLVIIWFVNVWTISVAVAGYVLALVLSLIVSWGIMDHALKDALKNYGKLYALKVRL